MNQQVVIAGLIGAISAQVPCENLFTKAADAELAKWADKKNALVAAVEAIDAAVLESDELFDSALANVSDQEELVQPFADAFDARSEAYQTQYDLWEAADADRAAVDLTLGNFTDAVDDAQDLVDAKQDAIDAQELVIAGTPDLASDHVDYVLGLEMVVADLTTQLATMLSAKDAATNAYDAQQDVIDAAGETISQYNTDKDANPLETVIIGGVNTDFDGLDFIAQAAQAAYNLKNVAGAQQTVTDRLVDWKSAKTTKAVLDKYIALYQNGCAFMANGDDGTWADNDNVTADTSCLSTDNDYIKGLYTAKTGAVDDTAYDTQELALNGNGIVDDDNQYGEIHALGTEKADAADLNAKLEVANDNLAVLTDARDALQLTIDVLNVDAGTVKGSEQIELTRLEVLKTQAETNYNTVNGSLAHANTVLDDGRDTLAAIIAGTDAADSVSLASLNDALAVATYLAGLETASRDGHLALANLYNDGGVDTSGDEDVTLASLADLENLKDLAEATNIRAQKSVTFYSTVFEMASAAKDSNDQMKGTNTDNTDLATEMIDAAELQLAAAVATCKGLGYDAAQALLKKQMDAATEIADAFDDLKAAYDAKAAFATTGETNTLCAFPAKAKDADQLPRPECAENFCCGAAQKFLKDGTKLAIETCQRNEGVHTYQYYPPLPDGAAVEPVPETWRFQCISGAQKLIATATAALAASYMMA